MDKLQMPEKDFFKFDEVCGLTGVKPYVLRYWEGEFKQIDPVASSNEQKLYRHKDIETVILIKKMLFEDNLSVDEAKNRLDFAEPSPVESAPAGMKELFVAKENLRKLLEVTQNLKQSHNWHQ